MWVVSADLHVPREMDRNNTSNSVAYLDTGKRNTPTVLHAYDEKCCIGRYFIAKIKPLAKT
jgi:hypothetical protein